MASIVSRKTKKGEIRHVAYVRRKGHPSRTRTFQRLTDARAWAQRVEAAIQERRDLPHREALRVTVADAVRVYLDSEGFAKLSTREQTKRATQLGRWVWVLGQIPVAGLTPAVIREARARLKATGGKGRPIGSATLNRYMAALSKFCSGLVADGLLATNPARSVMVERGPEVKRDRVLTVDERRRLLDVATGDDSTLHALIVLALTTGGRQGEILGLRWAEVDVSEKRVRFLRTKNGEPRSVPLPEAAVETMKRLAKVRHLDGTVFGGVAFPEQAWRRVRRVAQVDGLRFHDLRHCYASALAEAGATLSELKHALGHKTLAMVVRYAHLTERATEERIRERLVGVNLR